MEIKRRSKTRLKFKSTSMTSAMNGSGQVAHRQHNQTNLLSTITMSTDTLSSSLLSLKSSLTSTLSLSLPFTSSDSLLSFSSPISSTSSSSIVLSSLDKITSSNDNNINNNNNNHNNNKSNNNNNNLNINKRMSTLSGQKHWRNNRRHRLGTIGLSYLILHSLTLMFTFTWLCYAQESDFALRPFSASLQLKNRRPVSPIDIGTSANNVVPRHSSTTSSSASDDPNLMPILTAPVPRGSGSNPRPSFQRIRLNTNNNQRLPQSQINNGATGQTLSTPIPNNRQSTPQQFRPPPSPLPPPSALSSGSGSPSFLSDDFVSIPISLADGNPSSSNFDPRLANIPTVPILATSSQLLQTLPPMPPMPPVPNIPIAQPQRQSFRRIKPPSHGNNWRNRPKSTPTNPPVRLNEPPVINPANNFDNNNNKIHGRGPVSAQDEDLSHKPNALDNEDDGGSFFGNRRPTSDANTYDDNGILAIESLSRSNTNHFNQPPVTRAVKPNVVPTPTIPLTYYTTFTYLTTVLRGQHTATLSREQIISATQLKPIDRNIVTAIEFSDGFIQPSKSQILLGTKTKGATTTIYNVASRVKVFNDDLYKVIFATSSKMLQPTKLSFPSSSRIVPTRVPTPTPSAIVQPNIDAQRSSDLMKPIRSSVTVRLEQLQKQLKKQLSLLTYYYTLIDGTQTQYSTRIEESSTNYNGDLQTLLPSIAPSIDSNGLLKIVQPTSLVSLGSRSNGQSTTVVNLALNNYIKFNNVKDAQIDINPTSALQPSNVQIEPTRVPNIGSSLETPGLDDESLGNNFVSPTPTPRISLPGQWDSSTPTPSLPIVPSQTSSSRSRSTSSARRPGIRIKLKPIRSKLENQLSRYSSKPSESLESIQPTSTIPAASELPSIDISRKSTLDQLTPTIVDQTPVLASSVQSEPAHSQRKKVAFTLRRPGSSGINRFFSRRPSSHLFYPATISPSAPINLPSTSSVEPLVVSSSPVENPSTSMYPLLTPTFEEDKHSFEPKETPSMLASSAFTTDQPASSPVSPLWSIVTSPTLSVPYSPSPVFQASRKPNRNRFVVLTRLAGDMNKWSPLYNSRIRVSSRRVIKSTNPMSNMLDSSMAFEPVSSYETMLFETTTHTVPFTIGSTTTYTTVEETNTRILAPSMDDISISSDQFPTIEPTSAYDSPLTTATVGMDGQSKPNSFVIVETSDTMTISTLYSTYTYFATLFNGTQTSITPLEEIKTEYLTLREPVVVTRTIIPTAQFTSTSGSKIEPTSAQPKVSPTLASTISVVPGLESAYSTSDDPNRLITETYSTQTTLTHFITLFSGSHTILSSIEEVSPTIMTRTRQVTPLTLATSTVMYSKEEADDATAMPTLAPAAGDQELEGDKNSGEMTTEQPETTTIMSSMATTNADLPTPSPPLTTSGSISYETGPLDKEMFVVDEGMPKSNHTSINDQKPSKPISSIGATSTSAASPGVLEPGSVIELDELLEGVHDAGPIGETIKDIVKDIFKEGEGDSATTASTFATTKKTDEHRPITNVQPTDTTISPSFTGKTTPSLKRFPVYPSNGRKPTSGRPYDTTKDDDVIFSTPASNDGTEMPALSTQYVTSVEKSIRTLTLTSTKVYYTRDSPLTITSVLTTTLPPITYVSTIIGSKTILGTYNSITPTKTVTSLDGSSSSVGAPTGISSSVLVTRPTISPSSTITGSSSSMPTTSSTRPRLHKPNNLAELNNNNNLNKAKVASILTGANNRQNNANNKQPGKPTNVFASGQPVLPTMRNITMVKDQLCEPACNATNKEYCRESETNRFTCECRPGYVRRPSDNLCQEIKNYMVTVRVSKTAESEVAASSTATNDELQRYAKVARRQVAKTDGIAGLQVLSVDRSTRNRGVLMNMTVQIDHKTSNVHDELSRKLQQLGHVEKVVDFDECSSPIHNDCSPRARCINEPGSYSCECFEPYIDIDQTLPGRLCVSEIKSCDYCHGRGDCWRNQSDIVCKCHPMFIGRRCEINGLLLAILVPIVAILLIVAIVCFFYCSRKLRQRNRRFKNLAAYGPVAVIGGTLDRKAMLETSSESSDPQHRSSHYTNESLNTASVRGSMAKRNHHHNHGTLRRESEPSIDKNYASYSRATGSHYNSLPHQIIIPRARPSYTLHPGQIYMW